MHDLLYRFKNCRLPLMTLVAQRACNSTAGMIAPLVWNRAMMPSVGRSRDGGKILLQRVSSPSGPEFKKEGRNGNVELYPVQKITASMFSSAVSSLNMTVEPWNFCRFGFITSSPTRMRPGRSSLIIGRWSKTLKMGNRQHQQITLKWQFTRN